MNGLGIDPFRVASIEAMKQTQGTKEKIQALLILVGDQPLYAKAMEISWFIHGYGPDGFLPQMGQFHIDQVGLEKIRNAGTALWLLLKSVDLDI